VLETPLQLDFVRSTSIGVKWNGLDEKDAEYITGYVLGYKSEDDADWQEHNRIVRHRQSSNHYKVAVRNLIESTEYFFRIRVVGKGDKRGGPGPELKAITKCGSELWVILINPITFFRTRATTLQCEDRVS